MLLRRIGNKSKLNKILVPLFPKHDIYFEPFFGTGSVFFAKPLARHKSLS